MIRILSVLFFTTVLSGIFCRHLENTLSDARTIRKPNTVVDGNVLSENSIVPTVSDDASNSNDVLSNIATPIQERFSSAPSSSSSSSQDAKKGDSLDITQQQKEFISIRNSDSTIETAKDIEQELNPAVEIVGDNVKENPDSLTQSGKESVESIVDKEKHGQQSHKEENVTQSHSQFPSETPSISEIKSAISGAEQATQNSERDGNTDYEKNHGQAESMLTSDRLVDAGLTEDKVENVESDLPYTKLDNVNDANIDTISPVVRPELNHLDSDADKVQNIQISKTKNDVSSSSISAGEVSNIKTQNDVVGENQEETSIETTTPTPEATKTTAEVITSTTVTSTTTSVTTTSPLRATDTPQTDSETSKENNADMQADLKPTGNEKLITAPTSKATESDNHNVVPTSDNGQLESVNSNRANVNEDKPAENANQDADVIQEANKQEDIVDLNTSVMDNEKIREPDDVDPLDIFVDDIKFQRFPDAMPMALFKEKIAGKTFKKLYILESAEKKLFQHVRQLEVTYLLEGDELYAEFLFRFIYSRQCTRIEKFKLGTLAQNSAFASFEKDVEGEKTERLLFFSRRPDDYVFFMSCTDFKTSPYACRDTYYVTLDSRNDPPNQFPWLEASKELESEMKLTFEDPRFIFNFVMMPCARA